MAVKGLKLNKKILTTKETMCLLYMIAVASDVQNLLLRKEFAHAAAQQVDYSTAMGFCYWVWWICFFFLGGGELKLQKNCV